MISEIANYSQTMDVLSRMLPIHLESGNKFWSFLNLEVDKKDLEIHEFAKAGSFNQRFVRTILQFEVFVQLVDSPHNRQTVIGWLQKALIR
jgi:hypothetical protein